MGTLKFNKSVTNKEKETLEKYLKEIGREELLSAEEEVELARRIKAGDREALDKLTKANLRFVVAVAKQYQHRGLGLLDLINEGNIGLMKAAAKFDETKGLRFVSHAVWWIRSSIVRAIAEHGTPVRKTVNHTVTAGKVNRAFSQYVQENEHRPSVDEIARRSGLSESEIEEVLASDFRQVSVDAPFSESSPSSLLDILPDAAAPIADNQLIDDSLRSEIAWSMDCLDRREREVVEKFYGIDCAGITLKEIGEQMGVTRERARQIRDKAVRKLRKNTKSKWLKSYLS